MCYTFPSTPYQIEIKIRFATWGLLKGEPLPSLCSASAATPGKCRWKKFFFFRSLCGLCGLCGLLEIFISVFESARGRGGVKLPEVLPIPEKRGKLLLEAKKLVVAFLRTMFPVCLGCCGSPWTETKLQLISCQSSHI